MILYQTIFGLTLLKKKQQKPPFAIFMMGLPASGKSTVIDQFINEKLKLEKNDFIHIDPDLFMRKIQIIITLILKNLIN